MLRPLKLMLDRVTINGSDSDTAYFMELLYFGELVTKLTTLAFIAGLEDDSERNRYRLLHTLVRADGIGEWAAKLDEALSGPPSQSLALDMADDRRTFNEPVQMGAWQYKSVQLLANVLNTLRGSADRLPQKVILRSWFSRFTELRNKTRGHGAPTAATCSSLAPLLRDSILAIVENGPVFKRPWAYLHRNLSGRYRVIDLNDAVGSFDQLKGSAAERGPNYPDGIYIYAGKPRLIELAATDANVTDFFVANGAFNGKHYELHSLISDARRQADATPFLPIASERPASETEGTRELEVIGNVFSNMPARPLAYVRRPHLEAEIRRVFLDDRHPVVTLVGRGGIGKTSAALSVLHDLAAEDRFALIVWFSARDIDLTASGPKPVKAKALTERDISAQYGGYAQSLTASAMDKNSLNAALAEHLNESPHGPTLFVFDNFETVRNPLDLFSWIDTHVRNPNKVVITTRFREFKADYPVEVGGMEPDEASALIQQVSSALRIQDLIREKESIQIADDADGHPYIIKIMLGEVASKGRYEKPERMLVRKDDILDALFERTFANLTPLASRLMLILSGWRSLVPQVAAEAVLIRHAVEGGSPETAVDELVRMSLVERVPDQEGNDFLEVPLAAALFGRRKLAVSAYRELIEEDVRFLQEIGTTARSGLKVGLRPRILSLFRQTARKVQGGSSFEDFRAMLEFVARSYNQAWLFLADLQLELGGEASLEAAASYVRQFLEARPATTDAANAWRKLIAIHTATGDSKAAASALLRLSEVVEPHLEEVSQIANALNNDRSAIEGVSLWERQTLLKPLASLFEQYLPEASATDISRLAWLYLHTGDEGRARSLAEQGLQKDPYNSFCGRLVSRLS